MTKELKCSVCGFPKGEDERFVIKSKYSSEPLCSKHYTQYLKHGKITSILPPVNSDKQRICEVCGSTNKVALYKREMNEYFGMMLCGKHYGQVSRYGECRKTTKDRNDYIFHNDFVEIIIKDKNMNEICRAIIDAEDYSLVKGYKWRFGYETGYATTNIDGKAIALHKIITNTTTQIIDHIDRNKMNNRKENLRHATKSINEINKGLRENNTSGVTGVTFSKQSNKWRARINVNKRVVFLGDFQDKKDAIKSRLIAENKYYKDFAPQKHLFKEHGIEVEEIE